MAVPKKKISKSRRNQRRAHDALGRVNVVINKTTGELQLPHQVSLDGYYKGKEIIKEKVKAEDNQEQPEAAFAKAEEPTKLEEGKKA